MGKITIIVESVNQSTSDLEAIAHNELELTSVFPDCDIFIVPSDD